MEYADGTTETLHQTAAMWEKNQQLVTVDIKTAKNDQLLKIGWRHFCRCK